MDPFRPADPSLLGLTRMGFGLLMVIDCFVERGLHVADSKWSDDGCQFPLINGLKPLSTEWMTILQFVQGVGALFICIGWRVRQTGWLFIVPYWYMFLLDKTHWNNHSYLFGLMGILMTLIESDAAVSVSRKTSKMIPMWNYYLIRFQIFILYFYAGIKKTESDWLLGYSMGRLSRKWVFDPFRSYLTNEQIDLYIVHLGGFFIDMTTGPMLLMDRTRPIAILTLTSFHCMNSQMFSIGMFPYACLATMFIFCRPDSPKKVKFLPISRDEPQSQTNTPNASYYFAILYVAIQAFLPYSHSITQGYNGWTQGAYGYSWDMMIHSFSTQHVKISYKDGLTGEVGYLKPDAFIGRARSRYTMHPDMLKQYATCIAENLKEHNVTDPEVYFDVWKSMNERFVQRVYDPRIDVASYEWKWNQKPAYSMRLLHEIADWRGRLKELRSDIQDEYIDVTFIADHPGLTLENFLADDMDNTTIELMGGQAKITLNDQEDKVIPMSVGESIKLPPGEFHTVHCLGDEPAMYIYQNSTDVAYRKKCRALIELDNLRDANEPIPQNVTDLVPSDDEEGLRNYCFDGRTAAEIKASRNEDLKKFKKSFYGKSLYWLDRKTRNVRRGLFLVYFAVRDLALGERVCSEEKPECDPLTFYERLSYLDEWKSPFRSAIMNKVDSIMQNSQPSTTENDNVHNEKPSSEKTEL